MKHVLVCLHGWGGSKESFTELREALKDSGVEILTPDLPGFGSEPEPDHPRTTNDYAPTRVFRHFYVKFSLYDPYLIL